MLTCPMCKKAVAEAARLCPRCGTDLSLLADYVGSLEDGLARAESLTRQGLLDEAVWAYLEVLEVDPGNAAARRQVGRVATAIRQFDGAVPRQRWLRRFRQRERFRHWLDSWETLSEPAFWLRVCVLILLLAVGFILGYYLGSRNVPTSSELASQAFPGGYLPACAAPLECNYGVIGER